jgi:hypothetical protein
MITRASKFFYGAALLGFLAAVFYGFLTGASDHNGVLGVFSHGDVVNSLVGPLTFGWKGWIGDHVGYSVLMGFAGVMAALGGFSTAFRDGNAEAIAEVEHVTGNPPVTVPVGLSYWPLVAAFGVGVTIVGLAVDPVFFVVGCVLLAVVTVSWTVRAWAERATGDQAENRELRHTLMDPLEVPVLAVLTAAIIVLCVSRLLLAIPQSVAVYVIIGVAIVVFLLAFVLASRPELKRSVVVAVLLVGGLVVIGAGIAGGVAGEQSHHEEGLGASRAAVVIDSAPVSGSVDTWSAGVATGH